MFTSKFLYRIGTIAIVLMLTLSNVQTARAVSNDFFADATTITSLPFNLSTDTMMATYKPENHIQPAGMEINPTQSGSSTLRRQM